MDWSKLPDIIAVGLLASAFASVARRNYTRTSGLWLIGWLLILFHFTSFLFAPAPRWWGDAATLLGIASLICAGILFMWASVPYRDEPSSRWMLLTLVLTNTAYLCALIFDLRAWLLAVIASLIAVGPLAVALIVMRRFSHPLRWATVGLFSGLAVYLLVVEQIPGNGADLALNGLLFTTYLGCSVHFWYNFGRPTTGAFITISGFVFWALVFVIGPVQDAYFPAVRIESEVWNLPKFVVGIGMILLLLEEQIEHNKHLALHDVLTGLPNRRLFQDRLDSALERARRAGTQTALVVLDLDRFKQVNDTLGHHVGDLLLQRAAAIFSARVRKSDTVARTGGDEFSVILEAPSNNDDALRVGRSLQDLLKEPLELEGRTVTIGVSFGEAVFPDDAENAEALCTAADLRMYENKRAHEVGEFQHNPYKHGSTGDSPKPHDKSGPESMT